MINKIIFLLFLIVVSLGCRNSNEYKDSTKLYSQIQATIDSIYSANPEAVGIMAHIESPKNNLSWSGGTGYSNKDQKTRLNPHQPALIASCVKPYVSATILRLQELDLLTIEDSLSGHLTKRTTKLFEKDGYDLDKIKIKHLLSHTSGIKDIENKERLELVNQNKKYRWTRNEQLELAIEKGDPLGNPEEIWNYADANFLLCTEIIETNTNKPFYSSMRELLKYDELELENTWFPTLEEPSPTTKPMVHQYLGYYNWDSYDIDPSFDLYGGGGIATTTEELAKFAYNLFQGNIIQDTTVQNKLFTRIITSDGIDNQYYLGFGEGISDDGYTYYSHGGFWATAVFYFQELETSIAIYILEMNYVSLNYRVANTIVNQLAKHLCKN